MKLIKTFIFSTLFSASSFALDVCPTQKKPENTQIQTPCLNLDSPILFDKSWGNELKDLFWLTAEVEKTKDIIQMQTNEFSEVLRFYRDNKLARSATTQNKIQTLEQDFESLYLIQKEQRILKRKLNICYSGMCSAHRRVELEDLLQKIQRSQAELILKNPLLSTKTIENFFLYYPKSIDIIEGDGFDSFFNKMKMSVTDTLSSPQSQLDFEESENSRYSSKTIKKLMIDASIEALANLNPIKNELSKFSFDRDMPLFKKNNEDYAEEYLKKIPSKYPLLTSTVLFKAELTEERSSFLCQLNTELDKNKKRQEYLNMTVDGALLLGPIFLGPIGRVVSMGARPLILSKLVNYGIRSSATEKAALIGRFGAEGLFLGNQNLKITQKENECSSETTQFYLKSNQTHFEKQKNCHHELAQLRFEESLSWLTFGGYEAIPSLVKKYKFYKAPSLARIQVKDSKDMSSVLQEFHQNPKHWAYEFQTKESGTFTVMDLAKIQNIKEVEAKTIPKDYWHFVGNIYKDRLNLTPEEIKGFVKTSEEMQERTKLIINSPSSQIQSSTKNKQFNGGIGIVESRNSSELLPIEKSTGKRFERKPNEKSVEIVRLTVSKDAEKTTLSKDLTSMAMQLVAYDPEISKAYIYTSKSHAVLYRRMGVPQSRIQTLDERDVYIELTRADILEMLKKQNP